MNRFFKILVVSLLVAIPFHADSSDIRTAGGTSGSSGGDGCTPQATDQTVGDAITWLTGGDCTAKSTLNVTDTTATVTGILDADDVRIDGKVITMTGDTGDTATLTAAANGELTIATTDAAAAAGNIVLNADGKILLQDITLITPGSAADPAIGSADDSDTGIWWNASDGNTLNFANAGTNELVLTSSTLRPHADDGLTLGTTDYRWLDIYADDVHTSQVYVNAGTALNGGLLSVDNAELNLKSTHSSPAVNIFDKILEFVGLLGAGIAVNAAFKWFEDEDNRKKLVKFFNILKENWQLVAKILGTLVVGGTILKVASAITTIAKVIKILAAPVLLKFLAIAGTAAFLAWATNQVIQYLAGGQQFVEAHKKNDATLAGTGVTIFGNFGRIRNPNYRPPQGPGGTPSGGPQYFDVMKEGTATQIAAYQKWRARDTEIRNIKSQRDLDLRGVTDRNRRAEIMLEAEAKLGLRAMGGPVSSGKAYIVGERGPEIFAPNVDGSIINNMRTEKIYQMISSDIEGDIDFIELPPITNKIPPPNVPSLEQATDVPMISSTNSADPYLQVSPKLYGVMV